MARLSLCFGLTALASGSLLIRGPDNPGCVAYGNATIFNITHLGPMTVKAGEYQYTFDCRGLSKGCGAGAPARPAVCQHDVQTDISYDAGEVVEAMWFAPFNFDADNYTVLYPNKQICNNQYPESCGVDGNGIRISRVTFIIDPKLELPTIKFLGEDPYTEYNFEIRGKSLAPSFGDGV